MQYCIKPYIDLVKDLLKPPSAGQLLTGKKLFRPFLGNQRCWLQHFYPQDSLNPENGTWYYLRKYMFPLLAKNATSYHLQGIARLQLDTEKKPDFERFCDLFYKESGGFEIYPVFEEIEPHTYFSLIRERKFPCVEKLRPLDALFCGNEPDFWHEAIGHIAPLCFEEVQEFYLKIAEYVLSAKSVAEFQRNMAVAWTITEYAFIKEQGTFKMFGAALTGSHLAHMRFEKGLLSLQLATGAEIVESGFYQEETPVPRDENGAFRFFYLNDFNGDDLFC